MNSKNYLELDVIEISQFQAGTVFVGKIKFSELSLIRRLTERKESLLDPFGDKSVDFSKDDEEFQRHLSSSKLNKIAKFLKEQYEQSADKKAIGFFPTSIIIALDHDVDYEPEKLNDTVLKDMYSKELSSCFLNEGKTKLYIPRNKKVALIVDGQHRYCGFKRFYESLSEESDKDAIKDFEFATTFLLGFDMYQLAEIFATVNFEQKPVNRSLYYDIFGSIPNTERNDIKLAHYLALHLNNNEKSPIRSMIKMLGRGYGLFSQAFFVEKMLMHFREKGVWEPIYADYLRDGREHKKLPIFMRKYLDSVEKSYSFAWPKPIDNEKGFVYSAYKYDFILCKTTGMGAIFRLIRDIYPIVKDLEEDQMERKISEIFRKISAEEAKVIFSKTKDFGGTGGEGLQVKLYKFLKGKLGLHSAG